MLKAIIVILLIGIVVSLFGSLVFLVRDQGKTRRTVNLLIVRVVLALVLMSIIVIATQTGDLRFNPSPIPGF